MSQANNFQDHHSNSSTQTINNPDPVVSASNAQEPDFTATTQISFRPSSRHGRIGRPLQIHPEGFGWLRQEADDVQQSAVTVNNLNRNTTTTMTVRGANISMYSPLTAVSQPITTQSALTRNLNDRSSNAYTRPQFRSKVVCNLECKYCCENVCHRGMKAILLADMAVELFSTDLPPESKAGLFKFKSQMLHW